MNKIIPISTEYLRPSRTIEILNLVDLEHSKQVYIYNHEGTHYRFFDLLIDLIQFFESGNEPKNSFLSENELDEFLEKLLIN
jgi:hypothetical protein